MELDIDENLWNTIGSRSDLNCDSWREVFVSPILPLAKRSVFEILLCISANQANSTLTKVIKLAHLCLSGCPELQSIEESCEYYGLVDRNLLSILADFNSTVV